MHTCGVSVFDEMTALACTHGHASRWVMCASSVVLQLLAAAHILLTVTVIVVSLEVPQAESAQWKAAAVFGA
jgi:hypothetical protein